MYTGWFTGGTTKLPYGTLDSNLGWKGSFFSVKNPLPKQIEESDFENFFHIKNM